MTLRSENLGKWVPVDDATYGQNLPCCISEEGGRCFVSTSNGSPMVSRTSYERTRQALHAALEAIVERYALGMSVQGDGVTVSTGAELDDAYLFSVSAGYDVGGLAFSGVRELAGEEVESRRGRMPALWVFAAICGGVAPLLAENAGFSAVRRRAVGHRECYVFSPTVLAGTWEGSSWEPGVKSASTILPEVLNETVLHEREGVLDLLADSMGRGVQVGQALNEDDGDFAWWARYAFGFTEEEVYPRFLYDEDGILKMKEGVDYSLEAENSAVIFFLRAVFEGNAELLGLIADGFTDIDTDRDARYSIVARLRSALGSGFSTGRLDGFCLAGMLAALARLMPVGALALERDYGTEDSPVHRLAVAEERISRVYSYTAHYPPPDGELVFDSSGCPLNGQEYDESRFVITWSAGENASWQEADSVKRTNVLAMGYAESGGSLSRSGSIQIYRTIRVDLGEYLYLILSSMEESDVYACVRALFKDPVKYFGPGASTTSGPSGDSEQGGTDYIGISVSDLVSWYGYEAYRTISVYGGQSTDAVFRKTFSAYRPFVSESSLEVDLTGLGEFPCTAAVSGGYAGPNGGLSSFWTGSVSAGGVSTPFYCVPKSEYVLADEGDENKKTVRTEHVGKAIDDLDACVRAGCAKSVAENENYSFITDRDGIAGHINQYESAFPTEQELRHSLPSLDKLNDGKDADWSVVNAPFVWFYARSIAGDSQALDFGFKVGVTDDPNTAKGAPGIVFVTLSKSVGFPNLVDPPWNAKNSWAAESQFRGLLGAFDWKWKALSLSTG